MIPKIIHYCWFGPNEIGKVERRCIESWKKHLPGFEIRLWNEANFDIGQYPFAAKAYQNQKFAFVSDVARLHALYHQGGIYLDTDMFLLKDLSAFLNESFFIGCDEPDKISVGIFGSEKGNEVVKQLLEEYKKVVFDSSNLHTIPNHFNKVIREGNLLQDITTYPPDYFYALPFQKKHSNYKRFLTERSVAVHLWNHSWKDEFSSLKNFFFLESYLIHLRKILTLKKECMSLQYFVTYYSKFYKAVKQKAYYKYHGIEK